MTLNFDIARGLLHLHLGAC